MKTYLLQMSKGLHTRLKIAAAFKGISMMDFIISAIEKALKEEG
jgi:predicted HicB family RNase H-like nuclease